MRNVVLIPHQQLQRVHAGAERQLALGLTAAKVQMVEVVGYRLIERRQVGIDQQVVMSRIRAIDAGRRYAHVSQAEMDGHFGRNGRSILEFVEIHLRSGRRLSRPSGQRDIDVNAR